jgi:hypothetical protein
MRYAKAALIGLLSGVLLTAAVLAVGLAYAERVTAKQMARCEAAEAASNPAGGGMCDAAVQFGHVRYLGLTFIVGFAGSFAWYLRRQRRVVA